MPYVATILQRFCFLSVTGAVVLSPASLSARNRYLEMPERATVETSRAHRYANMSNREAFNELERRRIHFRRVASKVRGVRAPIRLTGRLQQVLIRSTLPETEWETTVFNILDARLALALDDFCRILRQHDIVELVHFTMYRAPKARGDRPQYRHPGGLAIDVGALKKRNGEWLSVGPHWSSMIGARTCGGGARKLLGRRGRELMSIMCEVADQRIFHYMLSPHFDQAHGDHWHFEIKPGVKWFLVN